MDTVLHGLDVGRADELKIRPDTLGGAERRQFVGHPVQAPVHRLGPEPRHGPRIRAVADHCGDRPGVPVDRAGLQHAELVALRVGKNGPRDVTLAHVGGRRAETLHTRDQVRLMGCRRRGEVDVHAVLSVLDSGTAMTSMQTATGSGYAKPTGSRLVTPGSSLSAPQPSASAQNRPTAESSRAFIAI